MPRSGLVQIFVSARLLVVVLGSFRDQGIAGQQQGGHAGCVLQRRASHLHGIDDTGLHIVLDGAKQRLEVDNIILCTGQEPNRKLHDNLRGISTHLIGGADIAAELDAKRAIDQGTRLAARI